MKKIASMLAVGLTVAMLGGCANAGASSSAEATAENPMVLTLAHGLSETHTVHIAMTEFADKVEERTDGRIQVRILPNGQLGSENENMEQLMAGVISMTKVSAPGLATYNESYHTFGLPYIFDDTQDFYHVMDSEPMQEFFLSSADDGFVTITYYTSGARSFYTVNKPIRTPADLKGLKIRVQDMKSQTDMLNALGGIPVAMAYGDVYTSLQTGIIDGTENNETALTTGKHGEICKVFSTDEHAMIPDVLVMSAKTWAAISPEDQEIILEAAHESTESHKIAWDAAIDEAIEEASTQMGVEFVNDVDKEAFREATSGMVDEYCAQYPGVQSLLDIINSIE
ncbi:MAG TPA: TRAP transporter substrate-binding protein [Candidatus Ventrisoma faecale]|nr:TRAP transporter substrate-binding protein [Candidatus Ventrisoma faecale]